MNRDWNCHPRATWWCPALTSEFGSVFQISTFFTLLNQQPPQYKKLWDIRMSATIFELILQ